LAFNRSLETFSNGDLFDKRVGIPSWKDQHEDV